MIETTISFLNGSTYTGNKHENTTVNEVQSFGLCHVSLLTENYNTKNDTFFFLKLSLSVDDAHRIYHSAQRPYPRNAVTQVSRLSCP